MADQPITDDPRYHTIVNEMQDAARSNLIFGMHCHVGIENREIGLQLMNQAIFLPHIFALSTNSPFGGEQTGYKSFRTKVLINFLELDYQNILIQLPPMITSGNIGVSIIQRKFGGICVTSFYDTIEFRICDMSLTVEETMCIIISNSSCCSKII
jgi:carboxylate-amine ligase